MSLNEAGVAPVSVLCSSKETWFGTASMNETPGMLLFFRDCVLKCAGLEVGSAAESPEFGRNVT